MKYCKRCLLPDTKPGLTFVKGICSACKNNQIKKKIDWGYRKKKLIKIINKIKKNNPNSQYDCIVPISNGGKDSWFQAHFMKNVMKCKVLCVNLSAHLPTPEGISNINSMIKSLNVDILKLTLKPSVHSALRLKCFKKYGEPNWAEHLMVFAGVYNAAKLYDIPLIVWGEDISFEFGGYGKKQTPNASNLFYKNDLLKNKSLNSLIDENLIKDRDLYFYNLPSKKEIKLSKIKNIYLGYYVNWDGEKNYNFAKKSGFKAEKKPRKGHLVSYDNIDEKLCEVNGWLKYLKFGFGYATDELCYDIYNKRITREKGIKLLKKLNEEFHPDFLDDFCRFHKIGKTEFYEVAYEYINKDLFIPKNNFWTLKNYPK